jgi:hypothetical protein
MSQQTLDVTAMAARLKARCEARWNRLAPEQQIVQRVEGCRDILEGMARRSTARGASRCGPTSWPRRSSTSW